jgi:2-(1,2-epoxy-1,2-dihydrophenyl)acetyl-CoA isomerase
MAQDNVEIVRSILAAWESGDFSSADWADPEIHFIPAGLGSETHGIEALSRQWREFLDAWDEFATVPKQFLPAGDDRVLVLVRFQGRGRGSGTPVMDFEGGQLFSLRDGKVVKLALYSDTEKALDAAGLSG